MNRTKKINIFYDDTMSRQEKLFGVLVIISIIGLALGVVMGIVAKSDPFNLVCIGIFILILIGIMIFSIRYKKIQLGAVLVSILVIYVALPFNFFTSGGIYGGAPMWFLFGVVYVCLVVNGKIKYFFLVSSLAICLGCYYLAYFHAHLITINTHETMYVDSIATLIIVSSLTCGMILLQNKLYRIENDIAKKQKKKIEELNKAQNNFFSSMSHEIRTPINTIIGLNEMILREDVSDEVAADARDIQNASKMLLALINDILDMSKMESGKMDIVPVTYNVGDMLSDIVNMIWLKAREKGLAFHIDVEPSIPVQLFGDEVRIKQVLINILNNAVKYTTEGSVTLSINYKRTENGNAQVIYTVADTGIGIKKESIPYLFSAFKRVDEEKNRYIEGTGLGLSIVKQLVDLMGGEIAVNSVYTKGSTFVITIPQKIANEEVVGELNFETRHAINARKHYRQSFEAPNARILIVDDNETNLLVAEKLLRDTKLQIDTVTSGRACLDKTLNNHYNVILMDHFMPVMDGIECLHKMRNQTGGMNIDTPVVVLTANAGGESQALYRREGFDGYLLKPVTGTQLENEIIKHLPRELVSVSNMDGSVGFTQTPLQIHNKKVPIIVSTDSICDLPKNLIEKYKIAIIANKIRTDSGEFMDGVEIETEGILSYIQAKRGYVYSAAPSVAEYEEFFAEQLTKAQYVIHIATAKNASVGYANSTEAAKVFDNVVVVDSGQLSSGLGLMVLRAAEIVARGYEVNAAVKELEGLSKKVRTSFVVDSTEYLARSGRISANINKLCDMLMLHPILVMKNNSIKVGGILLGTKASSWRQYIASVTKNADEIDTGILFITHAGLNNSELREIEEQVRKKIDFKTVIYQKASPAISINCGPGCFGLLYIKK